MRVITHRPDLSVPLTAPSVPISEAEIKAQEPSTPEMILTGSVALLRSLASGFKTVTDDEALHRREICLACDYWYPDGNLGLGKCRKAGCGCTSLKWKLATEKCPLGKWPEVKV